MGCVFSGHHNRASLYRVEADPPEQIVPEKVFSWERADRPDAKDFVIKDLKGEVNIRSPGSVHGQQFIIENCDDCSIYLFDNSAAVSIDDCNNCRILVGPVDGSLFIRDCKNCSIVAVCRQFRTRDCYNCRCMLLCCTKPIIESSSRMQFGCFDTGYEGLTAQLESIQLSKFQNFWSDVYDFTPGTSNWDFLAQEESGTDLLSPIPCLASTYLTLDPNEAMPRTHGQRPLPADLSGLWFIVFSATAPQAACQLIRNVKEQLQDMVLIRTNEAKLGQPADDDKMTASDRHAISTMVLGPEPHIGLEFQGSGSDAVESLAKEVGALMISQHAACAQAFRFAGTG